MATTLKSRPRITKEEKTYRQLIQPAWTAFYVEWRAMPDKDRQGWEGDKLRLIREQAIIKILKAYYIRAEVTHEEN